MGDEDMYGVGGPLIYFIVFKIRNQCFEMNQGTFSVIFKNHMDIPVMLIFSRWYLVTTALQKDMWDKLDEFFLNNNMSWIHQLQDQFRNRKKGSFSIIEFCHSLNNLG